MENLDATVIATALPAIADSFGENPVHLNLAISCYLLSLAVPLSGWLMSSAKGVQTVWFGVLPLPDLLKKDEALGDLLQTAHLGLNLFLLALVLVHIGAALKHHLIDRDEVLSRMLPGRGPGRRESAREPRP